MWIYTYKNGKMIDAEVEFSRQPLYQNRKSRGRGSCMKMSFEQELKYINAKNRTSRVKRYFIKEE